MTRIPYGGTVIFALYHIWTAGFGTPIDHVHMGIHLAGLFFFIFASFPVVRSSGLLDFRQGIGRWQDIPLYDWGLMLLGIAAALFLWLSWCGLDVFGITIPEQALRQGNPTTPDVVFGTCLIVAVLEIARRTIGFALPLIISVFMIYALFSPYMPARIL